MPVSFEEGQESAGAAAPQDKRTSGEDVQNDSATTNNSEDDEMLIDELVNGGSERTSRSASTSCCCCWKTFPERWPRTFALWVGVILPLFVLIAVSCLFGYGLARLESPGEIVANDDVISTRAGVALSAQFVTDLSRKLPHVCLAVYFSQNDLVGDELPTVNETLTMNSNITRGDTNATNTMDYREQLRLEEAIDLVFVRRYVDQYIDVDIEDDMPFEEIELVNTTDLMSSMSRCGSNALKLIEQYELEDIVDTSLVGEGLSFNWMRCTIDTNNTSGFKGFFNEFFDPLRNDTAFLRPEAQESFVLEQWRVQQRGLYTKYFEQFYNVEGMPRLDARWQALQLSFEEATGHEGCDMNWYAGAWFWFTIMTTIGYGNTAPTSDGARAMVFTLGFLSILLFAAVLAKAGSIVTTIADDASDRLKLSRVNKPWVGTLFWGCLYYGWMCIIALYAAFWKDDRLGVHMPYKDAYWFSFISTTTVGLGDYYLDHEVIQKRDLVAWPLLFLTGFVLLSSFLNKLSEWMMGWFPQNGPTLEENLENTDVPCFPKLEKNFLKSKKKKRKAEMLRSAGVSRKVLIAELDDIEDEVEEMYGEEEGASSSNDGAEGKGNQQPHDEEFANEQAADVVSTPVEAHGADGSAWTGTVTHPR
mmetsp:Transcript_17193/g.49298  ORF Transcript_17193/g.49298 Transcript_17193/m.49298 type:complete len:645 (+) Transcript_17193:33-1967(+)